MSTLYITEPGARIEKEYHQLLVTKDDEVLARTPLSRVSHVVLVGNVGTTTPALLALLDAGVGLSLVSTGGKLRGRLVPATGGNAALRQAQYRAASDTVFCTRFARAVTCGKLRNSRTMMQRLLRRHEGLPPVQLLRLEAALEQAAQARSVETLRGLEGSGARAYFGLFRQALRVDLAFEKRARRPPPDPVNALLSLGYTLLNEALMTALEVVGLDPYAGFFHADKYNRPALALDMVEEFRAPIVDSLVLTLINKRLLGPEDFVIGRAEQDPEAVKKKPALSEKGAQASPQPAAAIEPAQPASDSASPDRPPDPTAEPPQNHASPGVYLSRSGLRIFFREFADRLETETMHPVAGRRLSYRKIFEVQARQAAKVVTGERDEYRPFEWR